ncbi:MAG: hypothetical protein IT281_05355 [Ignavibacteria bacterium]|nr:hypothetical protein [Ignavibacteria bacterium]MCC7158945.1 hypothetical protein [Ignavibacteria bacterium]
MRKFLIVVVLLLAVKIAHADQLQWITKDQAAETKAYFWDNEIKQVILWCACCDNDMKMLVNVEYVGYKPASDPNYYEFFITGTTFDGKKIDQEVDLAYVHILRGSKWRCLGKELKFECDPCTKPFKF